MSINILYHAFGLHSYEYICTQYEEGNLIFSVKRRRQKIRCPVCDSRDVVLRGTTFRRFKTIPIGSKKVFLDCEIQRVECRRCRAIRQENIGFADPRFTYSRAFERYALDLLKHMTIQDVAKHLGISWGVIKEMQKRDLAKRFSHSYLKRVRQIAVDEIAISKGHKYLTVVLDMDTGRVIFVGDSKGGEALAPFWKRLKRSGAKAFAMDMSPAYIGAVSEYLPNARIVFDHFHVIKLFNEKFSPLTLVSN
jgi:transposase